MRTCPIIINAILKRFKGITEALSLAEFGFYLPGFGLFEPKQS